MSRSVNGHQAMLDLDALFEDLESAGVRGWREPLEALLRQRLADSAHGDLPRWRTALASLPAVDPHPGRLDSPVVTVGPEVLSADAAGQAREALSRLIPWRKGPFRIGGLLIDAEWRSDRKWARLEGAITPLDGRSALDVGCGNGYYALRMRGAGARFVLGIDPTLLYVIQFQAIRHWMQAQPVHVLPLRLHELPTFPGTFDTAFSMGVLYHQRSPQDHLRELHATLATGGELVLETLVLPGSASEAETPERYARMRNVWLLPTLPRLLAWLDETGFTDARIVDVTRTTIEEQRSTEWMPYESLEQALDPEDPRRTVEGWPAPRRAIVICRRR